MLTVMALIGVGLTVLSGCHAKSHHYVFKSKSGHEVPRIVSTVPAATQILLQLRAGRSLVAVSTYDKPLLAGRWRKLPVIGNYLRLNTELMTELHPSRLILQIDPALIPADIRSLCHRLDCRIIDIKLNSVADLEHTTLRLGAAAGCVGRARLAVVKLAREIRVITRQAARVPIVPVIYCLSTNPLRIVGGKNFMDDELRLAGGRNVGRQLGDGFPKITHAELLRLNAKKILVWHPESVFHHAYRWLQRRYGGRVCRIAWPDADLLTLSVVHKIRRINLLIHAPATDRAGAESAPALHQERKRRPA
jgi:ABC-type hemin transport system substrate-binding protein